jgi:hypothetical protein
MKQADTLNKGSLLFSKDAVVFSRWSDMHINSKRNVSDVTDTVVKTPDIQEALRQHREWLANFQRDISQISSLGNKSTVVNGNGVSMAVPHSSFADDRQPYLLIF